MIWSSNCFSNMTVAERLEYLYDKLESLDPSAAPDLTDVKQRLANVEADIRRLDREIDDIDLSGINDEIEAINNQLQSITDAQNTQAANIAALQSGKQDKLTAGANITLTPQADGTVKISSTGGGGGGGGVTVDGTVTQDGTNPVTGAGIYQFVHDITDPMSDDLDDIAQDIVDLQNANTTTSQTIAGMQTTQQQQTADIQQLQTDVDAVEVNINAILGDYVKESVYTPFVQQTNNTLTEHTQQIKDLTDDKQDKLVAGDNITLDPQTDGTVRISSTASGGGGGGGGGGSVEWTKIITESTDIITVLPGDPDVRHPDLYVNDFGQSIMAGGYTLWNSLTVGNRTDVTELELRMTLAATDHVYGVTDTGVYQYPMPSRLAIYAPVTLFGKTVWRLAVLGTLELQSIDNSKMIYSYSKCYCVYGVPEGTDVRYVIW